MAGTARGRKSSGKATITDVAAVAGVSVAAVSKVINGKGGISEPTRQRVLAAADKLQWSPSAAAVALRGARTRALGMVVGRAADLLTADPHFALLISGVESELAPLDYGLLLHIVGEDLEGVAPGAVFLRELNLGRPVEIGKRVAVVGGGNVAIDAARSALRLGAEAVTIVYRRSRDEMPASKWEIEDAEEEGVHFYFLANPIRILGEDVRVVGLECVRMALGEPDESGRRRPIPIEGSKFVLDVDMVIPAIGQMPDLGFMGAGDAVSRDLRVTPRGTLAADPDTLATEGHVLLQVFNIRGQLVRTLVDGHRPAGEHSFMWDGTTPQGAPVASGSYLYRLQVGDFSQTRRMILIR